ncbi:PorP/SprF family type IX secretion system membrane protein [Pedobacter sp. MW01-1-1]|uniref:PorP/SprF family type IX secretion system membrane protein n=1 Tax=Pedobacter sp. MW01-1-1 TaxID=3383027 RepID=UPI003FF07A9B
MRRIKLVVWFLVMGISLSNQLFAQQNVQFSQYIFNSLTVNPAYAGYKEEWFAQMALRAQWVGMDGAPRTASASIDGILDPLNKKNGVGLQLTSDKVGPQSSNTAVLNYAFRLPLNLDETKRLSFGVGVGIDQYSLNGNLLTTLDPDDVTVATSGQSDLSPDLRLGVYYNSDNFYAGVSFLDILQGNDINKASSSLNIAKSRHAYTIIGGLVNWSYQFKMRASLLVKDDFRGPSSADINIMGILNDKIWLGGSIRTGFNIWNKKEQKVNSSKENSISAIAQFFITPSIRLGYSYDYVTSRLGSNQYGTQEITLGFTFGQVSRAYICSKVF